MKIIEGENSVSQIASREEINPKQIHNWKREFCDNAAKAFSGNRAEKEAVKLEKQRIAEKERLEKKVGQLVIENDWLKKKSSELLGIGWEEKSGFKE